MTRKMQFQCQVDSLLVLDRLHLSTPRVFLGHRYSVLVLLVGDGPMDIEVAEGDNFQRFPGRCKNRISAP